MNSTNMSTAPTVDPVYTKFRVAPLFEEMRLFEHIGKRLGVDEAAAREALRDATATDTLLMSVSDDKMAAFAELRRNHGWPKSAAACTSMHILLSGVRELWRQAGTHGAVFVASSRGGGGYTIAYGS